MVTDDNIKLKEKKLLMLRLMKLRKRQEQSLVS